MPTAAFLLLFDVLFTQGCGPKSNRQGAAGFSPCFRLPGLHNFDPQPQSAPCQESSASTTKSSLRRQLREAESELARTQQRLAKEQDLRRKAEGASCCLARRLEEVGHPVGDWSEEEEACAMEEAESSATDVAMISDWSSD